MIDAARYTSGGIAVANLSASIDSLELRRVQGPNFDGLLTLSKLLFLRGDLLGRITDHDRAEFVANEAIALSRDSASALYIQAQLGGRFHRFAEAIQSLDQAAGYSKREVDTEKAALLQATGKYPEALAVRERLSEEDPGIHTIGALAVLLAEMDQWTKAEACYLAALDADTGTSSIPSAQLLFEWGVSAMRHGDLNEAEAIFAKLDRLLPQHVPGRGHRAEVALARGHLDIAEAFVRPTLHATHSFIQPCFALRPRFPEGCAIVVCLGD